MMNSEEFTKFMKELRTEYGLPPKLYMSVPRPSQGPPVVPTDEPEPGDYADDLTEEDGTGLWLQEDIQM